MRHVAYLGANNPSIFLWCSHQCVRSYGVLAHIVFGLLISARFDKNLCDGGEILFRCSNERFVALLLMRVKVPRGIGGWERWKRSTDYEMADYNVPNLQVSCCGQGKRLLNQGTNTTEEIIHIGSISKLLSFEGENSMYSLICKFFMFMWFTSSLASLSAPASRRSFTIAMWFFFVAAMSAVFPCYTKVVPKRKRVGNDLSFLMWNWGARGIHG